MKLYIFETSSIHNGKSSIKITVFWDVTPSNLVDRHQHFREQLPTYSGWIILLC